MINIPFSFIPPRLLDRIYHPFLIIGDFLETAFFPTFNLKLKQARMDILAKKYLTFCFINNFVVSILIGLLMYLFGSKAQQLTISPITLGLITSGFIFLFAFFQQIAAPQVFIKKRIDSIEQNILPALQNVLIQLRSGIPLFDVMVNVASSQYGEVSKEFMSVVKKINGGIPQTEALERMALENPSGLFRSAIWQMVNGMKTGTNLSDILRDIMSSLAEEQLLQVEEYGAVLSPLTMFYMIMAVILPAIGVNFLIVIVSFMSLEELISKVIFWSVYGMILFIQIMFLNTIKTKRPSLLKV
jgi:pilus assembly protein TadC